MKEGGQAASLIQADAAQMLRVDRGRDVFGDDGSPPAGTHDRDQDIARMNGVASQRCVLRLRDVSRLRPAKLVRHGVVDPEHRDSFVDKLAVQQLTSEWPRAYSAAVRVHKVANCRCQPPIVGANDEHFGEQRVNVCLEGRDHAVALSTEPVCRVQHARDPPLLVERREGDAKSRKLLWTKSRQIRPSRPPCRERNRIRVAEEAGQVVPIESRARCNREDVCAAYASEGGSGDLGEVWTKLPEQHVGLVEDALCARDVSAVDGTHPRESAARRDVLQPDIHRPVCDPAGFDDLSENRRNIFERSRGPVAHPNIPFNSPIPALISSSSFSSSRMISAGGGYATSADTTSL